ncbi:MAG TPA: bifunctional serine/threonine-protein kinase/formylglycine-generating enzyme family protein, partial [Fimbriiglobus sp.]|nr:bifunctional serine/threonine-protein kinase/formylglycine-generating enzyme family protein [Fimbriiglobus sp.]
PPTRPDRGPSGSHSVSGIYLPGQSGSAVGGTSGKRTTYWASVARIGVQVAGALAYAHRQGVLHRDVKPANLLLDLDGVVWVTDFGLAKADDSDDLTRTGDLLGTLRYMPPEAFEGRSDARSDVYALGLTLFELVALRPAYEERDRNKLVKQVTAGGPPPLRKLRRDAPRDLVTVVEKATDKDPARRYQSAGALADDLQRFLDGRPITARRTTELERLVKWVRRNPAVTGAAATVLLVTILGVAGVWWKYLDAERQKGIALQEADKATRAREFLASIFQKAETDDRGGNVTVRQLLDEAETRIPVEFANQTELRLELVQVIGRAKRGIARRVPQAMILEVHGAVQLQSADGAGKAAVPQALVHLDDRLTLGADARLQLVFLSDLHKEWLKAGREATVDTRGCEPADAVRERDASPLMTFVRLPKGTFYMGWGGTPSGEEEVLRATASLALQGQPLATAGLVAHLWTAPARGRKTEIQEDFEMAVHAVTQGQWQAVMGNNPSWFSRKGTSRYSVQDISDEELKLFPVEMVSWDDAQEFLKRLNEQERGRGYLYRLPTEAEWEYACRGGATSLADCSYHFYFGQPTNDLSSEQANFNGNYPFGNAGKGPYLLRPTRVGAYPPNRLGLCDMHGNVRQWTSSQEGSVRVYRGGDWFRAGANCRAGLRTGDVPTTRYSHIGFRLIRVPVR